MKPKRTTERGQILVLLALAMIGMLGLTALAVDGGMIYADRRYMQSAADASSIAGAGQVGDGIDALNMSDLEWSCTSLSSAITAAYDVTKAKATVNDFEILKDGSLGTAGHDNGVKIICSQADKYVDVMVMLTRDTNTSFVHLFTGGSMRNTVTSVTRVEPGIQAGAGWAIVSLSKYCGNNKNFPTTWGGVGFNGTTDVKIIDGGVWSNSCLDAAGDAEVYVTENNGNTIKPNSVLYHAGKSYTTQGNVDVRPAPIASSSYHPLTDIVLPSPAPDCIREDEDAYDSKNNIEGTLAPGNYGSLSFKGATVLQPGLYCIRGTVSMNASASISGQGITIYYTGTSITINGGAGTSLQAPNEEPVMVIPKVPGTMEDMLLYVPPEVKATITINGTSDSYFTGTLYAPGSYITISGNATMGHATVAEMSMIGYRVDLTGASNFNIRYNNNTDFSYPPDMDVRR